MVSDKTDQESELGNQDWFSFARQPGQTVTSCDILVVSSQTSCLYLPRYLLSWSGISESSYRVLEYGSLDLQ